MKHRCIVALVAALALAACQDNAIAPTNKAPQQSFSATPSDGNGNKLVFPINVSSTLTCANGAVLNRSDVGWIQAHAVSGGRNLEVDVFHDVATFTNANGNTFVWRDVGPDRVFMQDGNLVIQITGRANGNLGTFIIDAATGNVLFTSGPTGDSVVSQACAALS
ncbi:MAG TPA: hypothetical protein VFD67_12510 [Gemmatimonadaceae bacterium]|nr:hypothetical protein [Gemmatimonadaceae bacterium]